MTMLSVTATPMNKGQFDKALAAAGWRRKGAEAEELDGHGRIGEIDRVRLASGAHHIIFETCASSRADGLFDAIECLTEHDDAFRPLLGIDDTED